LAVDPSSKRIGWAYYEGGEYQNSGAIIPANFSDAVQKCGETIKELARLDYMVVEDTYLWKNISTLKILERFGAIFPVLAVARFEDVGIFRITPQGWQSKMLGASKKLDRKDRKKLSIIVASDIAGRQIEDDNEADAINIGRFFIYYGKTDK